MAGVLSPRTWRWFTGIASYCIDQLSVHPDPGAMARYAWSCLHHLDSFCNFLLFVLLSAVFTGLLNSP